MIAGYGAKNCLSTIYLQAGVDGLELARNSQALQ
jgi:hypothetical protein